MPNVEIKNLIQKELSGDIPVFLDSSDLEPFNKAWRYEDGNALAVFRPKNNAQLSEIITFCRKHKIKLVPQGGNTGLVGASVADKSGQQAILSTQLLNNKLIKISDDKRAVKVGAGVILEQLQDFLQDYGKTVFIDIGSKGSANIGGIISTNAAGTRAGYYGAAKKHVKNLIAILPNGKEIKVNACGNIIKDATKLGIAELFSDYQKDLDNAVRLANGEVLQNGLHADLVQDNSKIDLFNCFAGSAGFFGIVAEAELYLTDIVANSVSMVFTSNVKDGCDQIVTKLKKQNLNISAIEIMSRQSIEDVCQHMKLPNLLENWPEDIAYQHQFAYLLEFENIAEQDLITNIEPFFANGLILDGRFGNEAWNVRHHISEVNRKIGDLVALDIAFPKSVNFEQAIIGLIDELKKFFPNLTSSFFGHKMVASVHAMVVCKDKIDVKEEVLDLICDYTIKLNGTYSAEHGIGPHNYHFYEKFTPKQEREFLTRVKKNNGS